MSEDILIKKIQEEADAAVEAIQRESIAMIADVEAQTAQGKSAAESDMTAALTKDKAHLETATLAKARQAASISVQTAKRAGVDAVFAAVRTDIVEAPTPEYIAFFEKTASSVVPAKVSGTAYSPKNRVEETKHILSTVGVDATVEADADVVAGFVLDTPEGVFDATLDRVISDARPRLEMEVIKKAL